MQGNANRQFGMNISEYSQQDSMWRLMEKSGLRVRYEWIETGFGS